MVIVSNNEYLQTEDLPWEPKVTEKGEVDRLVKDIVDIDSLTLAEATEELEKTILRRAKETCHSTREMANKLDVNQSTIVRKLQKYGLD